MCYNLVSSLSGFLNHEFFINDKRISSRKSFFIEFGNVYTDCLTKTFSRGKIRGKSAQ